MRPFQNASGLVFLLLAPLVIGCGQSPLVRNRDRIEPPVERKVEAASLVEYLNQNARRVQAVESTRVALDARQGRQEIGLDGMMACQKPRSFRLKAKVVGNPACDIGSNDDEFWYWISKAEPPYVYHCSHRDLSTGKVPLPFPFQPDMAIAALGIGEYDPNAEYKVRVEDKYMELIQETTSAQGQPVQKLTVFNRYQVSPPNPQVMAHVLKDSKGKLICQATIHQVQLDRTSGAILPTKVTLEWPDQEMKMTMTLYDMKVAPIAADRATRLFQRSDLGDLTSFDLAKRTVDNPTSLRRASTLPPGRPR